MFKTIQKIFLCSFFISSSVFPMRQIAQAGLTNIFSKTPIAQVAVAKLVTQRAAFHDSLIARCFIFNSTFSQDTENQMSNEEQARVATQDQMMHDSESSRVEVSQVRLIDENTIECRIGLRFDEGSDHDGSCSAQLSDHNWQPSSSAGVIETQHNDSAYQAQQHLSEIMYRVQLAERCEFYAKQLKSTVSTYFVDFKSVVENKVSKAVDFNLVSSIQEISAQKAVLSQTLCMLEKPFLEFTQQNPKFSFIADATQHGFYDIPYHVKDRWTDTDYKQALVLLELKAEIEAIKATMQLYDGIIDGIKQEPVTFALKLKNASVDTLEKEIIPDLVAKKEKINVCIDQQQAELRVRGNKVKDIEDQLESFNKRSCIARICHPFTSTNLANQQKAAQAEWAKTNKKLQSLYDEQTKYSDRIEQALDNISEKHQIMLQEAQLLKENIEKNIVYNQALQSQHDACDFSHERCFDRELQHQWSQRQDALCKTIDQGYAQYEQEFILNPQTAAFLDIYGVDYKKMQSFFGTDLQQQLHGQMCYVLSQAAAMQKPLPYKKGFLTNVVDFADAAYDANKNNQILLASRLLDVDCYLLQLNRQMLHAVFADPVAYAQAVLSGLAHGVVDTAHMFTSPCETVKGLGQALYYVLETVALNASEDVVKYPEIYGPMRDKRNAEIVAALKNLGHQFETSTGPQRVEALVRFGTNFYAPGKVIHAIGGVCGFVQLQAKGLRTLEGVASLLEEQGVALEIVQAAEKVTVATQENVAKSLARELVNAEVTALEVQTGLPKRYKRLSIKEVVEKLEKCKGKISGKKGEELYHNVEYYTEKANALFQKIGDSLLKEYKKMTPVIDNPKMSFCIDLEHVVNPRYSLVPDSSGAWSQVELKGGHLAGTMLKLEKEGLVEILSKPEPIKFGSGCVQYQVKDLLTGLEFPHTEFPPHWTVERIAQEIRMACEKAIKDGLFNKNNPVIKITVEDGFDLKIVTNHSPLNHTCEAIESTINRHVVTARPDRGVK